MASHNQPIGQLFLRATWLFQAIVAGPTFVLLGFLAFIDLWSPYAGSIYDFVTHIGTALLAAGIIFLVVIQRKIPADETITPLMLNFETAKAGLASGLWLWLMLDATLSPRARDNQGRLNQTRIAASAISFALLP